MSARVRSADKWRVRVLAREGQDAGVKGAEESADAFWDALAAHFAADPRRSDPIVDRLVRELGPNAAEKTVLDVGGGAGRFALPLALRCRHVTVVEPSESLVAALLRQAREHGIENVSVVQERWEQARVPEADVTLCAHVLYGVPEIEPFVRKLEEHAREMVLLLSHVRAPLTELGPAWMRVHGTPRIALPALPELLLVLWETGRSPDVAMFRAQPPETVDTRGEALYFLRHLLYVQEGTEADRRLNDGLDELLEETPAGLAVRGAPERRQGLVWWSVHGEAG